MNYTQISVTLPQKFEDVLSAFFLQEFHSPAVIDDPDLLPSHSDTFDSREKNIISSGSIKVTCALENYSSLLKEQLLEFLSQLGCSYELEWEELEQKDWQEEWKKHYSGIHIPGFILVVPPWLSHESSEEKTVIINPGNGFGTGTHPTTFMCLQEMKIIGVNNKKILDVGAGSGIIGISAAAHQAAQVLMLEKFADALENAQENININSHFVKNIHLKSFDVESLAIPDIQKFDIVFANIILNVLKSFISLNSDKFKNSAIIIMTGVLKKQDEEFSRFLTQYGLKIVDKRYMDDWCLYKTVKSGV